jgi:hypothetical protein
MDNMSFCKIQVENKVTGDEETNGKCNRMPGLRTQVVLALYNS